MEFQSRPFMQDDIHRYISDATADGAPWDEDFPANFNEGPSTTPTDEQSSPRE